MFGRPYAAGHVRKYAPRVAYFPVQNPGTINDPLPKVGIGAGLGFTSD
jgi:hypothetical protein